MNDYFVNPYTFIPVNNGVKKPIEVWTDGELLTGKISCTLRTRTQIAVCDEGSQEREKEFFSIDGKRPVIPGSALRGVVRSIFEALTDSCLSSVNAEDDDYFSSRMNKNRPGLLALENGKYVLYEARRYADNSKQWILDEDKTGDEVIFEPYEARGRGGAALHYINCIGDKEYCFNTGYIHKVDSFSKGKNHNSVFEKSSRTPVSVPDAAIERLRVNLDRYSPNNEQRKKDFQAAFDKLLSGKLKYLPVWYILENGNYYFAPSQMSRSIYFNKPIDLLKKQDLDKCASRTNICEACALFGIVSDRDESFAVPSRVRFADAECLTENPLDKIYRLPILANPRLSSFEFYLSNPNNSFGADDKETRIAGRKYYWHNNKANISADAQNKKNNKMDNSVRLVKAGTEFRFEVFFDRITENALRRLVFAINLGENNIDGKQCHKIGHGKPIGLGSVKIVADHITVRNFSGGSYIESDRTDIAADPVNKSLFSGANVANVLKVTDFEAVKDGDLIGYPSTANSTDIFKWFAENRKSFNKGKPKYAQKLPRLGKDPRLSKKAPNTSNQGRNDRSGYVR